MKINLDPAVYSLPYKPNIDIRKDIDYKKVMKDHGLGYFYIKLVLMGLL